MALETGVYISDLVPANPGPNDLKSLGDDHLRLIKSTLKTTFPNVTGAVTAAHTDLNNVTGLTGNIQAQINLKGAIAGQAWTGTQNFTGATVTAPTKAALDNTTNVATTAYTDAAVSTAVAGQLNSPAFTGTPTAPTAAVATATSQLATTLFVSNAVGASGALPAQPGGTTIYNLQSVGSVASWAVPAKGRTYFTAAQ